MNVTELARQLKVTTTELFDKLPGMGFDIGRRAIKVDNQIALKIIDAWKRAAREEREKSRMAAIRGTGAGDETEAGPVAMLEVRLPAVTTVRELSQLTGVPVNKLLGTLLKNGVLTSMNERIDFDTVSIIAEELGFKVVPDEQQVVTTDVATAAQDNLKQILADSTSEIQRPPVIVVMGHVDHGKTKILDTIRSTDVISGESGGITQHIGAYQINKDGRLMTFIDTPGHEAFTAMRSRGARVADIAILVVAADDGVQPQTKEAIKIIQDAKLPFVVAINKIDKPEANIEKTKQDLSSLGLLPEDWGGNVTCVPVSAREGTGMQDLLETLLLMADINADQLRAEADRPAIGTIIESHIDKGEGAVATLLVQVGTLRVGDIVAVSGAYFGKIRSLKDHRGQSLESVGPGTPAKILGLKLAPDVGSIMEVSADMKLLTRDTKRQRQQQEREVPMQSAASAEKNESTLTLMVKADVLGSVEAIIESLAKLDTAPIAIRVISKGLGAITEADVLNAEATGAILISFHIKPTIPAANLARDKEVEILYYEVIYHLIEEVERRAKALVKTDIKRILIGTLEVLKVFRREAGTTILGGRVTEGTIAPSEIVIIVRNGEAVASGTVNRLESGRQVTDQVPTGTECGVNFVGKGTIEEKDTLEFYKEEK